MTDTGFYDEDEDVNMLDGNKKNKKKDKTQNERLIYAAPFHTQVAVLLGRTWRTIWREKVLTPIFYYSFKLTLSHDCHHDSMISLFYRRRFEIFKSNLAKKIVKSWILFDCVTYIFARKELCT